MVAINRPYLRLSVDRIWYTLEIDLAAEELYKYYRFTSPNYFPTSLKLFTSNAFMVHL